MSNPTPTGQCARCGGANPYTAVVCGSCGSRLPWAAVASAAGTRTAAPTSSPPVQQPTYSPPRQQPGAVPAQAPAASGKSFGNSCISLIILLGISGYLVDHHVFDTSNTGNSPKTSQTKSNTQLDGSTTSEPEAPMRDDQQAAQSQPDPEAVRALESDQKFSKNFNRASESVTEAHKSVMAQMDSSHDLDALSPVIVQARTQLQTAYLEYKSIPPTPRFAKGDSLFTAGALEEERFLAKLAWGVETKDSAAIGDAAPFGQRANDLIAKSLIEIGERQIELGGEQKKLESSAQ